MYSKESKIYTILYSLNTQYEYDTYAHSSGLYNNQYCENRLGFLLSRIF